MQNVQGLKIKSMNNKKIFFGLVVLLVIILLRFLYIEDCYPSRAFFDFGKSNDGIERICGQSSSETWTEK